MTQATNLGTAFEQALITAVGWDSTSIAAGSTSIDLINPNGPTTVRGTIVGSIDTTTPLTLVGANVTPVTTTPATGTDDDTGDTTTSDSSTDTSTTT